MDSGTLCAARPSAAVSPRGSWWSWEPRTRASQSHRSKSPQLIEITGLIKIKVKGGGQGCPPYTSKVTALIKISSANRDHCTDQNQHQRRRARAPAPHTRPTHPWSKVTALIKISTANQNHRTDQNQGQRRRSVHPTRARADSSAMNPPSK